MTREYSQGDMEINVNYPLCYTFFIMLVFLGYCQGHSGSGRDWHHMALWSLSWLPCCWEIRKHLTVFSEIMNALKQKPFSLQKSEDGFSHNWVVLSFAGTRAVLFMPLSCWCEATFHFYLQPTLLPQNYWSRGKSEWFPEQDLTGDSILAKGINLV